MLVLDSNIWIHAVTVEGGPSESYINRILFGDETCAVSPYIHEEVVTNIDRDHSVPRRERDRALEQFSATVGQCPAIDSCRQDELRDLELDAVRREEHNRLIGALSDIQAKDAPVLTLAYEYRAETPTILTEDAEFAACNPSECGVPEVVIEHVELEWDAVEQTVD